MNQVKHSNRESALMTTRFSLRHAVLGLAAVVSLAACSDDKGAGPGPGGFYLRIVNATFQGDSGRKAIIGPPLVPGTVPSQTAPAAPYKAVSIDVLIDSSETAEPSIKGMAPNSVSGIAPNVTTSHQTGPNAHAAGYAASAVGVRSYVARINGYGGKAPSFYTTQPSSGACQQYLPKQYMTAGTFYTLVVAGIHPGADSIGKLSVVAGCASGNISQFPITSIQSVDDPFTPPTFKDANGNKVLQARFHIWNAAPFASTSTSGTGAGASVQYYLTPDSGGTTTGPKAADLAGLVSYGSVGYRAQSSYVNVTAGNYYLSITNGTGATMLILAQAKVSLGSGDVRSFFFLNDFGYVNNNVPNPFNYTFDATSRLVTNGFKLVNVLDNKYSL